MITFHGHRSAVSALAFSSYNFHSSHFNRLFSDGAFIASGAKDNEIVVWDIAAERGLYRLRGHTNAITALAFFDKRGILASASKDSFIRMWDMQTQHCVQTLVGHHGEVWSLAINSDQTRLVSGSKDNKIRVWRLLRVEASPDPVLHLLCKTFNLKGYRG